MLPKGGAYSKRYQAEERERLMQWQTHSARTSRDREYLLSKQTAQRQRALEQKKRAMEQAEEERRRRALEERRQAQREATERCKVAISRLRISSRTSNSRHRDIPVEILYASLPRQGGANKSNASSHTSCSAGLLGGGGGRDGRGRGRESGGAREGGGRERGGRVVLGAQVELRQDQINAVKQPPALEEVLRSLRAKDHQSLSKPPLSPSPSSLTSRPSSVQSRQTKTSAPSSASSIQSSKSEPNVPTHCPIYKVHHTKVEQPPEPSMPKSPSSKSPPTTTTTTTTTSHETRRVQEETEGMVFHPVVRGPLKSRVEVSRDSVTMRVVSPTQEESSSSCRSPVDSLSGNSSDAGAGDAPGTRRVVRRHKKIVKKENQKKNSDENSVPAPSHHTKEDSKNSASPGNQVYSNSSSDDESAPPRLSPPRSRRRRKLPPGHPSETSKKERTSESRVEPQGPKIVGILKKPRGGGSATVTSTDQVDGGREERRMFENIPGIASCASSTASSAVASERTRCREGAAPGEIGHAQVSRDSISVSSASTIKRVRFSDTLESSLNSSQASLSYHPTPASSSTSDQTIERLWKQILQNGSANLPPNGMFNPKMKISLTQKGRVHHTQNDSCDRITVHIPQAKTQPSEIFSSSSAGDGRQRKNSENEDARKERTPASFSSSQNKFKTTGSATEGHASSQRLAGDASRRERDCGLEQSPTDADIERVWDDIQAQLHGRGGGESERVTVAPQVYQFSPVPQRIGSPVGGKGGGGRYLPHRPQQKPTTTTAATRSQNHTHQKWAGPDKQLHHRPHHMTHPDIVQSEPSYVTVHSSTTKKPGVTGLSHEEQQLIHSLHKINQRLKEHEMAHGPYPSLVTPYPSHPPYYQPVTARSTHRKTNNITRHS